MLKGRTTIGRLSARCPAGTEPLVARLRLARLFGGADLAPHGFPPRAVLVIRTVRAGRGVALGSRLLLRPEAEREMREQVSALWRRAARPSGGRIPVWAEAVLFEDEGEWLAALGLAVVRGESGEHWCWRAPPGVETSAAPRQTLVRVWAESPRFIPAAVVRLARWGEAARFLAALAPAEVGVLLRALCSEFDLPQPAPHAQAPRATDVRDATPRKPRRSDTGQHAHDGERDAAPSTDEQDTGSSGRRDADAGRIGSFEEATPPPWGRWLASASVRGEHLSPTAQRLLAYASALFHAPTLARSRDFAEEVFAFTDDGAARRRLAPEDARDDAPRDLPRVRGDEGLGVAVRPSASDFDAADDATCESAAVVKPQRDTTTRRPHGRKDVSVGEPVSRPASRAEAFETHAGVAPSELATDDAPTEDERVAPWANLEGCETRLGGVLFLLNLLRGLRLPECFDEEYRLSEHITGWGLAELLARALLGDACAEFEDDPLWGALAHLDGRKANEPPAPGLRVGSTYRAPARWLKLFAPREDETGVEPSTSLEERFGSFEGLRAHGGARLPADLRRWMGWTFPFVAYALRRSLADVGGAAEDEESVRELLVRRGRLYCTATHVDLVMEASSVSFAARRAGLDASLGWVRDLMRVVAFHFE
jgi:hypothetical protein